MFQLDEQTQMIAGVVRQWCQSTLQPKIPALEHGTEMPFELMKRMGHSSILTTMRYVHMIGRYGATTGEVA